MNENVTGKKIDVEAKLRASEVYYSMGLLGDSLQSYEQILQDVPELDAYKQIKIREKIASLKKEIREQQNDEVTEASELSAQEPPINMANKTDIESVEEILDSASAFKKLGLFKEAIAKYEMLFEHNYPPGKIVPNLSECLFSIYPATAVKEQIESLFNRHGIDEDEAGRIQFLLGLEMEKRQHNDLAFDLYKSAVEKDPDNIEIKKKVDSLTTDFSLGSETDGYIVDNEKLQKADAEDEHHDSEMRSPDSFIKNDMTIDEIEMDFDLISDFPLDEEDGKIEAGIDTDDDIALNLEKSLDAETEVEPETSQKVQVDADMNLEEEKKYDMGRETEKDKEQVDDGQEEGEGERKEVKSESDVMTETEGYSVRDDEVSDKVIGLLEQILVDAYRKKVSHIHIEPSFDSKSAGIRFRMDGVCQEYLHIPQSMAQELLSRLKAMANLDEEETFIPQDGKIKFKGKDTPPLDLRVTTIPTIGEVEDIVVKILVKTDVMALDEIGLSEKNLDKIKNILTKPYGLMLVSGPTSSGKTTTLHSVLAHIKRSDLKIWTAEDPVEIVQTDMRQIEVQPGIGLDFTRIMRFLLLADGDVIMIGEMQEDRTASMAIQASLTGHLVFSSLNTEGACETVTTLLSTGLNQLNLSHALLGVLAQRLVRRLCTNCREEYHPSKEEFEDIVSDYGNGQFKAFKGDFSPDLKLYRPVGCDLCTHSGYKGRIGIHELMEGTPQIKGLIKERATEGDLFEQAIRDGMTTMKQDGINKVFMGLTDIDEVRRVCVA
ncbi:MAG: ATPase, T2SS/T4P/T4SS family [Thermodesulfobacteriota bacterium]|nr:ATPase, T2SS/T4P/T4SS family [Thermodesulfobacteriota bacterium]